MSDVKKMFPERLKSARKMRGVTQAELGKKCGCRSIAQFEAGARLPSAENVAKIAAALHVSTDQLLGVSDLLNPWEGLTDREIGCLDYLANYWKKHR